MCKLCDENGGELTACQFCSRAICFDEEGDSLPNDVIRRACVTSGGDLACDICCRQIEEAEEWQAEEEHCYDFLEEEGSMP